MVQRCIICGKKAIGHFAVPLCLSHSVKYKMIKETKSSVEFVTVKVIDTIEKGFISYLSEKHKDIFISYPKLNTGTIVPMPKHLAELFKERGRVEWL